MKLTRLLAVGLWLGVAFSNLALHAQTPHAHSSAASELISTPRIKNIFWQPNELRPGSVAFFTVEVNRVPVRVSGIWLDRTLTFFKSDNPKIWYALAGADVQTQPGTYDLHVSAILAGGRHLTSVRKVEVMPVNFRTTALDVPEQFVEPDAAEQKQIAQDALLKNRAYEHLTPRPLWSGDFIKPVTGPIHESFGETRILNEEKTSTHLGIEFPVKEGTPVLASNSGTVVLAKELYYEGNCVIVDHGDRFFTVYLHLARIDVPVGVRLRKGAQIGLSGATGPSNRAAFAYGSAMEWSLPRPRAASDAHSSKN